MFHRFALVCQAAGFAGVAFLLANNGDYLAAAAMVGFCSLEAHGALFPAKRASYYRTVANRLAPPPRGERGRFLKPVA